MAVMHVNQVSDLLGRTVVLVEDLLGVRVERRGLVTAYLATLEGSRNSPEFLLEQEDGDSVFYTLGEVELHAVM